jgi:hypothetical protein
MTEIKPPVTVEWPPVVHENPYALSIGRVCHEDSRAQWERAMGRCEGV